MTEPGWFVRAAKSAGKAVVRKQCSRPEQHEDATWCSTLLKCMVPLLLNMLQCLCNIVSGCHSPQQVCQALTAEPRQLLNSGSHKCIRPGLIRPR